jgi:predicted NUDIX family NTP pyrophosphohydrolase
MLVTSRDTGRWVLPKGWRKRRLSGSELAGLEAFEEAGLLGEVAPRSIGFYRYAKRMPDGHEVECDVDVFSMRVATELDDWPEREQRQRRWFTMTEAAASVNEADLAKLLLRLQASDAEIPAGRKQLKSRATK